MSSDSDFVAGGIEDYLGSIEDRLYECSVFWIEHAAV